MRPRVIADTPRDVIRNGGISKPTTINQNKPRVKFMNLTKGSQRTQMMQEQITAEVKHVNDKKQLVLKVNNRLINNFDFSNGKITATIPLKIGTNVVSIKAVNDNGTAEKKTTFIRVTGRPVISKGQTGKIISKRESTVKKSRF